MRRPRTFLGEARLAAVYSAVSLTGFVVDALVLRAGLRLGIEPAWARIASLACAMQVTFLLNGLHVFRRLERGPGVMRQWAGYMAANGLGNLCNYWIFVTLVSTHWPTVANPFFAMTVGSAGAWTINYAGTRFLVFGRSLRFLRRRLQAIVRLRRRRSRPRALNPRGRPSPAAPGSARP